MTHIKRSLNNLSEQVIDNEARGFLRALWFGDMACSSGPHGVSGQSLSFSQIVARIEEPFSDDLVTALATYSLWQRLLDERPKLLSPETLKKYKDHYVNLVSPYYYDAPQLYGRGFPLLMRSTNSEFLKIAANNRGPGAVARMGIVTYITPDELLDDQDLVFLAGVTHLHPESIAAVFAVGDAIRRARHLTTPEAVLAVATRGAARGTNVASEFLSSLGLRVRDETNLADCILRVWKTEDPATAISQDEHIVSAKYVVASTFLIAKQALLKKSKLVEEIVEQSYAIGGDPDTICAITLGLFYAINPAQVSGEITHLVQQYGLKDPFVMSKPGKKSIKK